MSFIVLPRRRKRPDRFELDYGHELAQGLVFAGLDTRGPAFIDSSIRKAIPSSIAAPEEFRTAFLQGRRCLQKIERLAQVTYPTKLGTTGSFSFGTIRTSAVGTWFGADYFNLRRGSANTEIRWEYGPSTAIVYNGFKNGVYTTLTGRWSTVGTTRTLWFYVNGVETYTATVANFFIGSSLRFFMSSLVSSEIFEGMIIDPVFYARLLSQTEIAILANKTDPMLAGLIKEKRTAPIYFLPSVNHWELQIKVDEGEWVSVPNMSSEITEYIKSTGLTSGTYYARVRKFTNGVPSDWEYAPGVVYSAAGGGTPYEISYQFIFESGLELSSTFSSESLISSAISEECDNSMTTASQNESGMPSLSSISSLNENTPDTTNDCSSHIDSGFDSALNTSSTNETKFDCLSELSLYTESEFLIGSTVSNIFLIYHDNCADVSVAGTYSILQDFEIKLSELKQAIHSSDVATSSVKESYLDSSIVSSSVSESFINSESKIAEFNQTNYDGAVPLSTNVITSHPMSVILSSISISDVSSSINISEPYMISVVSEADIRYVEFIINDLQIIKLKTAKKQSAFLSTLKSNGSLVINKLSKR